MKRIYTSLLFMTICLFSIQSVFASSGDISEAQTLQEGQAEIKELKKQESILQFKWGTFQLGNESLGDIIKVDLSNSDTIVLESIVSSYIDSREKGEKELDKFITEGKDIINVKDELLEGKQLFYTDLLPFIQVDKLESFKKYVDSDLNLNEKSKDIQNKIEQKDIQQHERIEELYDDRDDHARKLRKQIELAITLKVTEKLDIFVSQEDFSGLESSIKIEIFTNIIRKFESAIEKLEENENSTRALDERIIGLEVVVDILDSYIDSWR